MYVDVIVGTAVVHLEVEAKTPQQACDKVKHRLGFIPDEIVIKQFKKKK